MSDSILTPIEGAIAALSRGDMLIVVDDEDRENEGDLVVAAEHATTETINFMATHGRGLICIAMEAAALDRLKVPMMVPELQNTSGFGTAFAVSVEASHGVSTGISAADRAETIRTLIDPASTPADLAMPGHMFPLRARAGGVLERRGQTEASVDLARLAGCTPAGVICEVMREDGEMMRLPELLEFGRTHGLGVVSVEQLATYRREREALSPANFEKEEPTASSLPALLPIARSKLPTAHGDFDLVVYRDAEGLEHSALIRGELAESDEAPLVRLHSECLTGDAFGSLRCDCGEQLREAMRRIDEAGRGAVLYLRQEGRGIGLGNKIRAYTLQDQGLDTVDANRALGFPDDARRYDVAAAMLVALRVPAVQLMSNNPKKIAGLRESGIEVIEQIPIVTAAQPDNANYLRTKAERMGHLLPTADARDERVAAD